MDQLFAIKYSFLIPLLPLLGAMVSGFAGAKILKEKSHWPIWIGVGISALMSISLFFGMQHLWGAGAELFANKDWYTWIEAGTFKATAGFWFDSLTCVMLLVVTGIGFFITVFAAGYMKGEEGYFRFFAYLGLFIFSMTCLVMGNNYIMLYLGWEGVGLCSYLLIGYYYEKPSAREAAKKAFLANRVGDFGFGLGIMLIWKYFHTVSYFGTPGDPGVLAQVAAGNLSAAQVHALHWVPFLLMVGAFGKSAQFPLYVWLPDAMEGPTPVSALIHAATMVTAGVYMIARNGVLFDGNPAALTVVAAVGAFTALFAATIALRQFDLKKVFAYSTISQLGYMFAGVAVLAPVAGVFHLITHAFFKALLFLSSGVVMHAMSGQLDMRKMSGLKSVLPKTRWLMLIGCLALAGVFPFAGFFSKDEIIGAAFDQGHYIVTFVLLLAAFLTAYYTFRLYFRVFEGPLVVPEAPAGGHGHDADDHGAADVHGHASTEKQSGVDEHLADYSHDAGHGHGGHGDHAHNHEPMIMILPLVVLAIGAVLAGGLNWPTARLGNFLGTSPSLVHSYEIARQQNFPDLTAEQFGQHETVAEAKGAFSPIMAVSLLIALTGVGLAYMFHLKDRGMADKIAARLQPFTSLLEAKYYVDEIYQAFIIEPLRQAGETFFAVDRFIVDGIVSLIGYVPQFSGFALKLSTQRGYLQGYAATMLLGIAAILLLIFA